MTMHQTKWVERKQMRYLPILQIMFRRLIVKFKCLGLLQAI